jgi:hypothetical protein
MSGADPQRETGRALGSLIAVVFAVGLHLVVGFFVAASGLLAPAWAVVLLLAIWITLLWMIVRLRRRTPLGVLLVPFAMAGIWYLVLTLGDVLLGWTA